MRMRIRDWAVALSLAAVLGVLTGGVYSGVTGWTGPSVRAAGTGSSEASLPAPAERTGPPAATVGTRSVPARSGPVGIGERAAPAQDEHDKGKRGKGHGKAKNPDKDKPDKDRSDRGEWRDSWSHDGGKPQKHKHGKESGLTGSEG